jgi:hypothetical protein
VFELSLGPEIEVLLGDVVETARRPLAAVGTDRQNIDARAGPARQEEAVLQHRLSRLRGSLVSALRALRRERPGFENLSAGPALRGDGSGLTSSVISGAARPPGWDPDDDD